MLLIVLIYDVCLLLRYSVSCVSFCFILLLLQQQCTDVTHSIVVAIADRALEPFSCAYYSVTDCFDIWCVQLLLRYSVSNVLFCFILLLLQQQCTHVSRMIFLAIADRALEPFSCAYNSVTDCFDIWCVQLLLRYSVSCVSFCFILLLSQQQCTHVTRMIFFAIADRALEPFHALTILLLIALIYDVCYYCFDIR
jgi:uncharacterized protein YggT (Ycf19 family)